MTAGPALQCSPSVGWAGQCLPVTVALPWLGTLPTSTAPDFIQAPCETCSPGTCPCAVFSRQQISDREMAVWPSLAEWCDSTRNAVCLAQHEGFGVWRCQVQNTTQGRGSQTWQVHVSATWLRQTVPSAVFGCLKGNREGKYHPWWGVTFRKAKEESQTEGRIPRQALVLYASGLGDQTLHERTVYSIAIPTCCEHPDSADGYFIPHTPGPTGRRPVNKHCKKRDVRPCRCLRSCQKGTYLQFQRLAFGGGEDTCLDRPSKLTKNSKNNNPEVLNTRYLWRAKQGLGRTVVWIWEFGGFGLFVWFCCCLVWFFSFYFLVIVVGVFWTKNYKALYNI